MDAALNPEFGVAAIPMHENGWRPIPLNQSTKIPAEAGWDISNKQPYSLAELRQIAEFHYDAATGIALPPTNVALDIDITDEPIAAEVTEIANSVFGKTPLIRIGLAPKSVLIYRTDGTVTGTKPHPIEIYCGSGQVVAFGWHAKANKPYGWPNENPLTITADHHSIPVVTAAQMAQFLKQVQPLLAQVRKNNKRVTSSMGNGQDASEQMRALLLRGLPFKRCTQRVLESAEGGGRHYAVRAVVSSGFNRGLDADYITSLIHRYAPDDLLSAVLDDGYLERVVCDFFPQPINQGVST
jgi:hypothetical protein